MRPDWKDYAFFGASMVTIVLMGVIFYTFQVVPDTWEARWDVVTWATTGIVGVATISLWFHRNYLNDQEFRQSLKSGYAERFKTGVELLASPEQTVKLGGITVLKELGLEQPRLYGEVVVELFTEYVNASGHAQWAGSTHFSSVAPAGTAFAPRFTRPPAYFQAFRGLCALNALGSIRSKFQDANSNRSIDIVRTSLEGIVVRHLDLSGIRFVQTIFEAALFDRCTLSGARFQACQFGDAAAFTECDLSQVVIRGRYKFATEIEFVSSKLTTSSIRWPFGALFIDRCDLSGSSFFADKIEVQACWAEGDQLPSIRFNSGNDVRVYDASGPGVWQTDGSSRQFVADAFCPYWLYAAGSRAPTYHVPR